MSAISSATFGLFVTAIQRFIGKLLMSIISGYSLIIIFSWLRRLYWQNDVFKSTTNFDHIKTHYYWSHTHVCFVFTSHCEVKAGRADWVA